MPAVEPSSARSLFPKYDQALHSGHASRLGLSARLQKFFNMSVYTVSTGVFVSLPVFAQSSGTVEGNVLDPDGAGVPHATITFSAHGHELSVRSNDLGHYLVAAVQPGRYLVQVAAPGFQASAKPFIVARTQEHLDLKMAVHGVEEQVTVDGGNLAAQESTESGSGTQVLNKKDLAGLSDDPDELLAQLQMFSATSGAAPGGANVSLDGFLGSSTLPSKWSIASVTINPDLYSAQYNQAPYEGGRIEVHTQAGAQSYHGTLFASGNAPWLNATDPFASQRTPSHTERFGAQLGGPVLRNKLDLFASLEHRNIDEYSVISAELTDASGAVLPYQGTTARPQQLWIGGLQLDGRIGPNTTLTLRYDANANSTQNAGVGGLNLPETGYNSAVLAQAVHLSADSVLRSSWLNQARASIGFTQVGQLALSSAPSILVPGSFQSGGAPLQQLAEKKRELELDDYLSLPYGRHQIKLGVQLFQHDAYANTLQNFNGSYLFGGNVLGTGALTGLQQYALALNGQSGGNATYYQVTSGNPFVQASQWDYTVFGQDRINLNKHISANLGLRYEGQTAPKNLGSWAPRAGFAFALGPANSWILHTRVGVFYDPMSIGVLFDSQRLNGINQVQQTVYNAGLLNPLGSTADVFSSVHGYLAHTRVPRTVEAQFGVEHTFAAGWHAEANAYYVQGNNFYRTLNTNAPVVTEAYASNPWDAPRPSGLRQNVFTFTPDGQVSGPFFVGLLQQTTKRAYKLVIGDVYMDTRTDAESPYTSPQSTYSLAGEWARPVGKPVNTAFVFSTLDLPWKLSYTTNFSAETGRPYDVITGYDNNGDGIANDRPNFLAPPSGSCTTGELTTFGCLGLDTLQGTFPRNRGALPVNLLLDGNLRRSFALGKQSTKEGRSVTINLRSSNLLNHTNVTDVDNVLLSPTFGQPYAARPGRRIEGGLHIDF